MTRKGRPTLLARLIRAVRACPRCAAQPAAMIPLTDHERDALARLSIWQDIDAARVYLEGSPAFFDRPKSVRGERADVLAWHRHRAQQRGATAVRVSSEGTGHGY